MGLHGAAWRSMKKTVFEMTSAWQMKIYERKVGETVAGDLALKVAVVEGRPWPNPWDPNTAVDVKRYLPTVGIVSGIHGNEVTSIGGLLGFLQELEQVPAEHLHGKVVAVPFANPVAIAQGTRCLGIGREDESENLNRAFSVNPSGSLADAAAEVLVNILKEEGAGLVIDLHTMNMRSLPMVIIDRVKTSETLEKKIWQDADIFGLGVVYDFPAVEYEREGLDASLSARLIKEGIASFTVEVQGGPFSLPEIEETVRQGLWNMVYTKEIVSRMWPGYNYRGWEHRTKTVIGYGIYSRFAGPRAIHAGFFRPLVSAGKLVTEGQVIGKIFNTTGSLVESVTSPATGLISDIADTSIVNTGIELFELLVEERK